MELRAGTSGFSYKEWHGTFYPDDLPAGDRLAWFAERLPTVEVNATFYRVPKREVVRGWAGQVPDTFRFSIKATRRLTHSMRLREPQEAMSYFAGALEELGPRLGVVLFQLPPNLKADVDLLRGFLDHVPAAWRAAFEFRHESWKDDAVHDTLRDRGAALVATDDEKRPTDLLATAPFTYVRLRREDYDDDALRAWATRLAAGGFERAFVFFKHEERAPLLARRLLEVAAE